MKKRLPTLIGALLLTGSAAADAQSFEQRLNEYIRLRADVADRMAPLASTANPTELVQREENLARALRAARKGAKRGDVIPPLVADQITALIREDFTQRAASEKAALRAIPSTARPLINQQYPDDQELAPVPPLLLKKFPPLPDNLQYRLSSRDLLLIDGDAQIVVDYVPNVLPPR